MTVRIAMPGWSWLRRHETKARFLVAGGMNTVFGLAIFPILMWTLGPLGVHYMAVLVICQIPSITFAYCTQKILVFRTKGNYLSEFRKFCLFYLYNFLINLAALPFLVEIVRVNPIVAQISYSLVVIVTSYFWHSRITFKTRERVP